METNLQNEEQQLLQASLMGDIREDIEFAGLELSDIGWIIAVTLTVGCIPFLLPLWFVIKLLWFLLVFFSYTAARYSRVPYRIRRWRRYRFAPKSGTGEGLDELLDVEPDAWLYKGGGTWQMVVRVQAPPWYSAVLEQKRARLASFEHFLRSCMLEKADVLISSEQVPDYRWEIWNEKESRPKLSPGIEALSQNRLKQWKRLAFEKEALRSEYVLRLSFYEHALAMRERDDEPVGATKEELRRFRLLADLRERKDRLLPILESSGHRCTLLSGFAVAEVLGRQWDPISWMAWKAAEGTWDEEDAESSLSETVETAPEKPIELPAESSIKNRLNDGMRGFFRRMIDYLRKSFAIGRKLLQIVNKSSTAQSNVESAALDGLSDSGRGEGLSGGVHLPSPNSPRIVFITGPRNSGKTFVAANLAVANASAASPVLLVDLSPDRGCLSIINPITASTLDGWTTHVSRAVSGLTVWTPDEDLQFLPDMLLPLIERLEAEQQRVVVDLPWDYPWRDRLLPFGLSVVLVDTDYHHWSTFERLAPHWSGSVWQNRSEVDMGLLVREHWDIQIERRFPTYPDARQRLFQGRPLALEQEVKRDFVWPEGSETQ